MRPQRAREKQGKIRVEMRQSKENPIKKQPLVVVRISPFLDEEEEEGEDPNDEDDEGRGDRNEIKMIIIVFLPGGWRVQLNLNTKRRKKKKGEMRHIPYTYTRVVFSYGILFFLRRLFLFPLLEIRFRLFAFLSVGCLSASLSLSFPSSLLNYPFKPRFGRSSPPQLTHFFFHSIYSLLLLPLLVLVGQN